MKLTLFEKLLICILTIPFNLTVYATPPGNTTLSGDSSIPELNHVPVQRPLMQMIQPYLKTERVENLPQALLGLISLINDENKDYAERIKARALFKLFFSQNAGNLFNIFLGLGIMIHYELPQGNLNLTIRDLKILYDEILWSLKTLIENNDLSVDEMIWLNAFQDNEFILATPEQRETATSFIKYVKTQETLDIIAGMSLENIAKINNSVNKKSIVWIKEQLNRIINEAGDIQKRQAIKLLRRLYSGFDRNEEEDYFRNQFHNRRDSEIITAIMHNNFRLETNSTNINAVPCVTTQTVSINSDL